MKKRRVMKSMMPAYCVILGLFLLLGVAGSSAITAITENSQVTGRTTIIVDPGHGGEDGGATSCTGVLESKFNLEISLKLRDMFRLLGYQTDIIRTTDISVYTSGNTIAQKKVSDLKNRVNIIRNTPNALLLSIHQNYFSDSRYSGAQVFYPRTSGSEQLAKQLQRKMLDTLNPGSHRAAKRAEGVYLMEHIDCTGVLIECGFLSNPSEEARLRSADYQKKLICVIASVCAQYLLEKPQIT